MQCIGTVLRDVVISEESLWVIAEALDAIFDIFADSSTADTVASNINLMALLEKSVHVLKARVSLRLGFIAYLAFTMCNKTRQRSTLPLLPVNLT